MTADIAAAGKIYPPITEVRAQKGFCMENISGRWCYGRTAKGGA